MTDAEKTRTSWEDLPEELHRECARVLGGAIIAAVSQVGGFSPGSADRVVTEHGRRAFVKAVERLRNPGAHDLHRREIAVMSALPPGVSAPQLRGSWEQGDWVALILDDVEGRHPGAGGAAETEAVLGAFATLPVVSGSALAALPPAADEFSFERDSWARLADDDRGAELPEWARSSADRLRAAAEGVREAVDGDRLLHLDARADNVLIDGDGRAWIIDWPWAGVGARWVDALMYLLDVRMRAEPVDVEGLLRTHEVFDGADPEHIDAVLAGVTGGWFDKARQPAPPNMPTLRAFQRREALTGLDWLRERWG